MLYFAYGSNLSHSQMKQRCPNSQFLYSANLENYKFVYDGYSKKWQGAVGNIIESPSDVVWGGVYEISQDDLKSLDRHEYYPNMYNRDQLDVIDKDNNSHQAITYFKQPENTNKPSDKYRQTCVNGAKECGLPKEYIEKVLN